MPIRAPEGYLDITNATLRASEIVTTSNVGIANANPTNTLSIGSNVFFEDTSSNAMTVRGNVVAEGIKLGFLQLLPSYDLELTANVGNSISNTVQFTNSTTGFITSSNVGIGTNAPDGLVDVGTVFKVKFGDLGATAADITDGYNTVSITESAGTYTYTRDTAANYGNFLPTTALYSPITGRRYRVKLTARSDYTGSIRLENPANGTVIASYDLTTSFTPYEWEFTATATTMYFRATITTGTTLQFNAFSMEVLEATANTDVIMGGTRFIKAHDASKNFVAIGPSAGQTSQGDSAVAVGYLAGNDNQGSNAIAVGRIAGETSQGAFAIAVGRGAGRYNQGGYATAVGHLAGQGVQGANATAVGYAAGVASQGNNTVAVGNGAGRYNQGAQAVAVGWEAGSNNQGENATALGNEAGETSQGNTAVAVGNNAGQFNQGPSAIAMGNIAGRYNQGDTAVAVGANAGESTQGQNAVAVGIGAGRYNQRGYAVAVGRLAGQTSQGASAVAVGRDAGLTSQGETATAAGYLAGQSNQGANAVAVGRQAGQASQGTDAVAVGHLAALTSQGASATAVGRDAARYNQGANAVAVGLNAGRDSQGDYSVGIGYRAGINTIHDRTVCINGSGTDLNTTGPDRTFIKPIRNLSTGVGYGLGYASSAEVFRNNRVYYDSQGRINLNSTSNYSRNGVLTITCSSDQARLVDAFVMKAVDDGNVIGWFLNAGGTYRGRINGINSSSVSYETTSDERLKKQIKPMQTTLDRVNALKPCTYTWIRDEAKDYGFVAQEVYKVFPEMKSVVPYSGCTCKCGAEKCETCTLCEDEHDYPKNKDGTDFYHSLDYSRFTPFLTKAIQELDEKVEEHHNRKSLITGLEYSTINDYEGLVVSASTNDYKNGRPILTLSNIKNDKKCYGVILGKANSVDNETNVQKSGDGRMWVVNTSGNLESGDLVTTSNISGYGIKQDDDILRSYTIAKITQDCDFTQRYTPVKRVKQELKDVTYYLQDNYVKLNDTNGVNKEDIIEREVPIYIKYVEEGESFDGKVITPEISQEEYDALTDEEKKSYTVKNFRMITEYEYNHIPEVEKADYHKRMEKYNFIKEVYESTKQMPECCGEYTSEIRQELVDVIDENGQLVWEDTQEMEPVYKIRYLDAEGNTTDEANAVHIAAFVGCTYHCG